MKERNVLEEEEMTLLQIRNFVLIAEHKSLNKAAELLNTTQPAISKQLSSLEQELGYELFIRSNTGVQLTPVGEKFYLLFLKFIHDFDNTVSEAKQLNVVNGEKLNVIYLDDWFMPDIFQEISLNLQKTFAGCVLNYEGVKLKDMFTMIPNGQADVAISGISEIIDFPVIAQTCNYEIIGKLKKILVYSKKRAPASGRRPTVADFKDEIFYYMNDGAGHAYPENKLALDVSNSISLGFTPRLSEKKSASLVFNTIALEGGFTLSHKRNPFLSLGEFECLELDDEFELVAVWNKNNDNRILRVFLEQLKKHYKKIDSDPDR